MGKEIFSNLSYMQNMEEGPNEESKSNNMFKKLFGGSDEIGMEEIKIEDDV
jgi:hypothetical protein